MGGQDNEDETNSEDEANLIKALGISNVHNNGDKNNNNNNNNNYHDRKSDGEEGNHNNMEESGYDFVPDPISEKVDLSGIRGAGEKNKLKEADKDDGTGGSDTDLENLAELVPDVKHRRKAGDEEDDFLGEGGEGVIEQEEDLDYEDYSKDDDEKKDKVKIDVEGNDAEVSMKPRMSRNMSIDTTGGRRFSEPSESFHESGVIKSESMLVQESRDLEEKLYSTFIGGSKDQSGELKDDDDDEHAGDSTGNPGDDTSFDDDFPGSDHALEDNQEEAKVPKEFINIGSSAQSISTATQTHEVRMPMYLPTFKPATGCTNASDFIVRCFVARLRSGITVVKHGRSRWCKSRLRVLHIHPDGRSLSWKPAEGEPTSSKRPPKLDLSTCLEVRHAWSPDPQNPMYTGTPILRQKCEAANAHKSFALIFKQRTVDITAVTADQCKVLMEGFSALCFRLQVANLAGRGAKKGHARPMPEEDGVSTTASATLTNTSTPKAR